LLRKFFQKDRSGDPGAAPPVLTGPRIPRHSSGWAALLKHLKTEPNLRVLDIGPTSPTNINFLTNMGHSVYMADLVRAALSPEWTIPAEDGESAPGFNVEGYLDQNLEFSGREFDVVLLWTTLDYLPEPLIAPVVDRLCSSMSSLGKVLALFHSKLRGDRTSYCRYHLTDSENIEMQESMNVQVQRVFTNRSIENLFTRYKSCKFFLAKDNVYETIITR
jgi:hypothetical protein